MGTESGVSPEIAKITPQTQVADRLNRAAELQRVGRLVEAVAELEGGMATARETPYRIEFQTRIRLGITLSDLYLSLNRIQDARSLLADEVEFADKISQIMQATGTADQKRTAISGFLQIRDRASQMALIGETAPEISVKDWIRGGPMSLADLRGQVVLLEFWATWCKPCQEMFPKLQQLYEEKAPGGLHIVAITRHYLAYQGTLEAMNDELELMRTTVSQHGVDFPVAVAADERLQAQYGANGLPTAVLIDRGGVVRYAGPGGDDPAFKEALQLALDGAG